MKKEVTRDDVIRYLRNHKEDISIFNPNIKHTDQVLSILPDCDGIRVIIQFCKRESEIRAKAELWDSIDMENIYEEGPYDCISD